MISSEVHLGPGVGGGPYDRDQKRPSADLIRACLRWQASCQIRDVGSPGLTKRPLVHKVNTHSQRLEIRELRRGRPQQP